MVHSRTLRGFGAEADQGDIVILILAGVVNGRANIEASEPGVSRAVPERAGKGSSMRQRAGKVGKKHIRTREPKSVAVGTYLKLKPRQIGSVEGKGKSAKIATTKARRIQNIDRFVIETFHHGAGEV